MTTNVLLVDDHPVFRAGLRMLLEEQSDMLVVGEAGDGQAAIELAQALSPDVVVMDITMPELGGIEATRRIVAAAPDVKVMALSIHGEKHFVEGMLGAGARGYLLKESAPEELVKGVRAIQRQQIYLSPAIRDIVIEQYMTSLADDVPNEATPATGDALLVTKLHRPKIAQHTVPRPRLLAQFSGWRQRPLTLISAPAGYGKSTVACQWLETCDCPSAWLSLDETDNDLPIFLTYLVTAIRTRFPDALQQLARLIKAPTLPSVNVVANMLTNELDSCPQRLVLVLEDYHHIVDPNIHELWRMVLRHPPHQLHLVLVTRVDPALDLLRLRAYHQMGEVRARALSFTPEETSAFLEGLLGVAVKEGIARELTDKTEGWVTGLRLITLSIHTSDDLVGVSNTLPRELQTLHYLIAEALSRQPEDIQTWLLKTSILDRFCVSLCEAICVEGGEEEASDLDGTAFVRWLTTANLFAIPLDHTGQWYRYHHLFQDLLRNQLEKTLSADEVAALHMRASYWLAGQELTGEALRHALAAGDIEFAINLVIEHSYELMNGEEWSRLERWLQLLPQEVVETNPILLLAKAWHTDHIGKYLDAYTLVDQAEALCADLPARSPTSSRIWGEIYAFRAYQQYIMLHGEKGVVQGRKALDMLAPDATYARTFAHYFHSFSHQMVGDYQQGVQAIWDAIEQVPADQEDLVARLQLALCALHWINGDLIELEQAAQRSLVLAEKYELVETIGLASQFLGHCQYLRDELSKATLSLQIGIGNRYHVRPRYYAYCTFALARIYVDEGRDGEAWQLVDDVLDFAREGNKPIVEELGQAFKASERK